jgi:hypothetical protein
MKWKARPSRAFFLTVRDALRNLKAPKQRRGKLFVSTWSKEPSSGSESFIRAVRREMMEHPDMRHPEFGLLCPPPRLLRELRIAFTFLLIGGVAGALCGSGILGLHSETTSLAEHGSLESTVGSNAPSPPKLQDDTELGRPPNSESSAAKPEPAAPGAAPPSSAVAPKARVVRIRRPEESPVIARLPLGRAQSPAPVSAPEDTPLGSTEISVPAAPDESTATPSQTLVTQSAAKERLSNAGPQKRAQKTSRPANHRRNEPGNDNSWRDNPSDYWSPGGTAANDERRSAGGRAYAREGSYPVRGFWDWSR